MCSLADYWAGYAVQGYSVLAIDCREHGFSTNRGRGMGWTTRESQDAAAATRYARDTLGYKRVVLLGTSQGAVGMRVLCCVTARSSDLILCCRPPALSPPPSTTRA